jgi:hypothetical protein
MPQKPPDRVQVIQALAIKMKEYEGKKATGSIVLEVVYSCGSIRDCFVDPREKIINLNES